MNRPIYRRVKCHILTKPELLQQFKRPAAVSQEHYCYNNLLYSQVPPAAEQYRTSDFLLVCFSRAPVKILVRAGRSPSAGIVVARHPSSTSTLAVNFSQSMSRFSELFQHQMQRSIRALSSTAPWIFNVLCFRCFSI